MEEKKEVHNPRSIILITILAGCFVVGAWLLTLYCIGEPKGTSNNKFDALGTLFSGLAFVGLIVTLLLQRSDLKMQREELELSRAEMKRQGDEFERQGQEFERQRQEMESQNKTLMIQRFEGTFFKMFEFYNNFKKEKNFLTRRNGEIIKEGDMKNLFQSLASHIYNMHSKIITPAVMEKDINLAIINSLKAHQESILKYLSFIKSILGFVNQTVMSNKPDEDYDIKENYINLFRLQLSPAEKVGIFYGILVYHLTDHEMVELIERFSIFKDFPFDLIRYRKHLSTFKKKAYQISEREMEEILNFDFKSD
ncbi:MAG: hypothetical protein JNM21_11510 [Taibaiella sp.]|nr:hypothetical protein [Taibaiella sp.]